MQVDYEAVYSAWIAFRKGKSPTPSIDEFAYDLENNLISLTEKLADRTYRHGEYKQIVLQEKKRRDLAVASVRDRVVHRLLYDHLLPLFDIRFDFDVWSCRQGKGLHKCLARTQHLLLRHNDSYIWRADIIKFFDTVDQQEMVNCLKRRLADDSVYLWLCKEVINSYRVKPSRGIPIGNLTSQLFANVYLNELDRFARHQLKPQAYLRYGDDFLIFYPTRDLAFEAREKTRGFLKRFLDLEINVKNDVIVPARTGLRFLGHNITQDTLGVDAYTASRSIPRIDWYNTSSYKALALSQEDKMSLDWTLLEKYVDIL